MRNGLTTTAAGCALALACVTGTATAQTSGSAVAAPNYVTIPLEIDVDGSATEVWERVGGYCDIGEWFQMPCTITAGIDGEVGSVRSVANEVLVRKDRAVLHLHAARQS